MIKYKKLKNLLIWKCKQKKVGSQLPTATRMAELEEVEPPVPLVLLPCTSCNRTFRPEALSKHAKVCEKTLMKKRKKFDSSKQRLQGTDVPVFPPPPKPVKESPLKPIPQSKWREKQAELAKTLHSVRKKSNGAPTIPIKPSDHEQCPYCDRFFGPKAYDRHAEWCKEQHTKLKNSNNINNEARERLQVRTKYRAPLSNKVLTRDKYLPRSRDPSPMSMSRLEVEEPSRTKLPSPALNRSSSLRMSGRSKSMVTKAPSIPPVELRDSRVRNHQSSINVRGREQPQPREHERASLTNGTDNAKPKIVNVNQHPKKVTEIENERSQTLRKCKSWTSPVILQPLPSEVAEGLQVYSCVLHPLTGKRSHESSASQSDGKKRSISVSKSFDILPHTYTIERNVVNYRPVIFDENDDNGIVPEPQQCDVDEDEDTGEMISDNILHQSDSWKMLPLVLLKIHSSEKLPEGKKRGKCKTVELKPPPLVFSEPKMICAPETQANMHQEEEIVGEKWEDEIEVLSAAADDFMMWFRNVETKCMPTSYHTNECGGSDTGASQFSFEENHESLFADLQMFLENSATSECNYSRHTESNHFMPPPNFVKIDAIVEINDVGTTVDDLEDYINQQLPESEKKLEAYPENLKRKAEMETEHQSDRQYENVSVQTALLSPYEKYHQLVFIENSDKHSVESDSLKGEEEHGCTCPQNSRAQESCDDGGIGGVYVVNSKGTLNTYKDTRNDGDGFYHLSDSNDDSLASYPFSFLNIPNDCEESPVRDSVPPKASISAKSAETAKELITESVVRNETSETLGVDVLNAAGDFIQSDDGKNHVPYKVVNPSLNDIIALIIDVKNRSQYIDGNDKMGAVYKALNVSNQTNSMYNEILGFSQDNCEVSLPTMKSEPTQVDFPCLKCLKRQTQLAATSKEEVSKTSWKSVALEGVHYHCRSGTDFICEENSEQSVYENGNYYTELESSRVSQNDSLQPHNNDEISTDSLESSDESSDWGISDTSGFLCSCEDCCQEDAYMTSKTVKYYETIEYRETKKGTSTIKTSVQELPPLRNPPKRLVAKTIKKEVRPVTFGEGKETIPRSRHNIRLNSSGEGLKLPPIKRRFEKQPWDVAKYDPFASAEQQMLELFGGAQSPPDKPAHAQQANSPAKNIQEPNTASSPDTPSSAFAIYTPLNKRPSSTESLKSNNNTENNNLDSDDTMSPTNGKMDTNKNFSLSNLSLCSIISIDSVDCNRNPVGMKSFRVRDEPLQRSCSAIEGKHGRNRVKVNMQQMLYGFDSPDPPLSPTRSVDVGNLEACEAELIVSMMEFEKMLNNSPIPTLDRPSPISPSSKTLYNDELPKAQDDDQDSKAVVPLSIDSAYGSSLTRASSGEGDAPRAEPSKFCHECGTKFPVPKAKFCCNCGIRRIVI